MSETFSPVNVASMPKDAIMEALAKSYAAAKPVNDQLVDISMGIQALTSEVYRRSIQKQLPGIIISRQRTLMKVNVSIHPNQGLPKVAERLGQLTKEGVKVTEVRFDENTGDYSFLGEPEFVVISPQT